MMRRPHSGATLVALAVCLVCGAAAPLQAGYSLPGYDLEVVQSGQGLAHAGVSYLMDPEWVAADSEKYVPLTASFTLPSCNDIDFARLYLDIWGGSPTDTATVNVSVNGTQLSTISIGGTNDANPTYNAATTCVYGSGYGIWQLAIAGVGNLLYTNGTANTVTWTVNDPPKQFDGRTYCASLITVYTSSALNQTLDYDLAEADGLMQNTPGDCGAPSGRTFTIPGVNTTNVTGATYYAGYTLGVTGQHDSLSFNGTALGNPTNDVAQGTATNYGPGIVSSNVTSNLSTANTVQYSVAGSGGQTDLRANIGLLAVTHPLTVNDLPNVNGVWDVNGGGTWGTTTYWQNYFVPGNLLDTATFGTVLTSGTANVNLDPSHVLSGLTFDTTGTAGYAISSSNGSQLTLANSGSAVPLVVSGGSQSIGVPVTLGDNLSVTMTAGSSLTVTAAVSGTHAVNLSGGGILVLAGNNSYSGTTTVTSGTLQIGNGGKGATLASPIVTMTNNATLAFDHSDAQSYNGSITGNGSLVKTGSGTLVLNNVNNYQGSTTIAAGTIKTAADTNTLPQTTALSLGPTGVLDLDSNAQTVASLSGGGTITDSYCSGNPSSIYTAPLTVNPASGSTTFAGSIAESTSAAHDLISLTLTGSGQLTLSGTNSYSGGTTVSGGTLVLASAQALTSRGDLVVSDGGQVVLARGGAPPTATLAAASVVGGDSSSTLNLLGSAQWSALAAQARAAQLTSSLDSGASASSSSLAASPVSYMATLESVPALAHVSVGSGVGDLSAVPEPGTLALLAAGGVMLLFRMNKRRP